MKYILKKAAVNAKAALMVVLLAVTFVSVSFKDIATLNSLPKEYADSYMKMSSKPQIDRNEKHKLSDYDYYYEIYTTSAGDTIILAPGEKKEIEGVSYRAMMKVLDNWAVNEYYVGYGDWVVTSGPIQPVRKAKFAFKLPDFKHEERIIAASAIPVLRKRNDTDPITSSVYFSAMREVSKDVDKIISSSLTTHSLSGTKEIFDRRLGKMKLRPFLSHLMYEICGGSGYTPTLGAVSEANTLHLYSDNWLIDNKSVGVNCAKLTLASFAFDDVTRDLVSKLDLVPNDELLVLKTLHESNRVSYTGQVQDTEELVDAKYETLQSQSEFMHAYMKRCMLLNAPYGFSFWLGSMTAGANIKFQSACINLGHCLGAGLQMINDLSDFSPKNPHRFSDLKEGKLTLPIWLKKSYPSITDVEIMQKVRGEVAACHNEAMTIMNIFPECGAKNALSYALNILLSSGVYNDFA